MFTQEEMNGLAMKIIEEGQLSLFVHVLSVHDPNLVMDLVQGIVDYKNLLIASKVEEISDLSYSFSYALDIIPEKKWSPLYKGIKRVADFFSGAEVEKKYRNWITQMEKK